jgi:two-component system sensor histidine kinase/response regulator
METYNTDKMESKSFPTSDIDYSFSDLVDVNDLQKLLSSFSCLTGITIGILDQNNNVVVSAGWVSICKDFHRANAESVKYCFESNSTIRQHLLTEESVTYKCKNGLYDVGYPIIVDGRHIATILFGQFFMDEKDKDEKRFELQAELYNFDKTAYLKAMHYVPVLSPEKVEHMQLFNATLAHMLTQSGYSNLLLKKEKIEELKTFNDLLKDLVQKTYDLNATKDKFFSIIAHDLRNPFAALLSSSELLLTYIENKNYIMAESKAHMIYNASNHAYDLLENLLEWSRSQTGSIQFIPENMNINSIVAESLREIEELANNKNIALINKADDELNLSADKNMLMFVLRNLISNAIKFTHSGGSVVIDAKKHDGFTEIIVIDTGIGIAKEHHDKIFRLDTNYSRLGTANEKGTSLGLVLCKEFIEKHNGKLWFESEQDKGSIFKFIIPDAKGHANNESSYSLMGESLPL